MSVMLSPELYLLKWAIRSPENLQQVLQVINPSQLDSKSLRDAFTMISKHPDSTSPIWNDGFLPLFLAHHQSEESTALAQVLGSIDVSDLVIHEVLNVFKERQLSKQIALEALAVAEGRNPSTKLTSLAQQLADLKTAPQEEEVSDFVNDDLEDLYSDHVETTGLRWRLQSLNRMLGSLRKGDFGFLFARPESGKTTFLASEVSYFAEQTDGVILWFNNEEQGSKVALRVYQASLGVTTQELYANVDENNRRYQELTGRRIKIVDNASITKHDVERLVKKYKPALILFDQLDKVKGFNNDREDLRLGEIYQWARELAKMYCPVIAVSQADGSGEGKKWLTMDNVANAKTAKQAEADWILGIGKSHDEGLEYIRHLHASKNKLLGDPDSEPHLRHGRIDVIIDPSIARYKDIGNG